jgi:predicted metalloprotease
MFDASQSTVIAAAVSAFINAELAKNEGIRERYEKLGRARREGTATKVHLIKAGE